MDVEVDVDEDVEVDVDEEVDEDAAVDAGLLSWFAEGWGTAANTAIRRDAQTFTVTSKSSSVTCNDQAMQRTPHRRDSGTDEHL